MHDFDEYRAQLGRAIAEQIDRDYLALFETGPQGIVELSASDYNFVDEERMKAIDPPQSEANRCP